jgi:hypothetical protein
VNSGLNKLSEERGEALAKEFDKVLQGSAYGARLAKRPSTDKISRDELDELATPLSIVSIPRRERDILIDVVMPSKPVDAAERRRLRNYTLLLWLAKTNERSVEEADVFEAAQRPPEGLPSGLTMTIDGWLAYVVRDCLAVCHEAVFGAVMRHVDRDCAIRNAPALANEVVAALVAGAPDQNVGSRSARLRHLVAALAAEERVASGDAPRRQRARRLASRPARGRPPTTPTLKTLAPGAHPTAGPWGPRDATRSRSARPERRRGAQGSGGDTARPGGKMMVVGA